MPVFKKAGKTHLYIHIPKTGGTSVESLLCKSGFEMHYAEYLGENKLNNVRWCSPQHLHAKRLQEEFNIDTFDSVFTTVRNPYARFKSEYCMQHFQATIPSKQAIEDWAVKAFAEYKINPYHLDNHLRPQSEFIIPDSSVFKLEDGINTLRMQLEEILGESLHGDDVHELNHQAFTGLNSKNLSLSQNTIDILNKHYAKDFALGSYSMECTSTA